MRDGSDEENSKLAYLHLHVICVAVRRKQRSDL